MHFYTSVFTRGNRVYVRGYNDGKRFSYIDNVKPYLFVPATGGKYTTLDKREVDKLQFDSAQDARQFTEKYQGVEGFDFFGSTSWAYTWIYDNFPGEINYVPNVVSVVSMDIETTMRTGFPKIDIANNKITSIALRRNRKSLIFSTLDYVPPDDSIEYVKCRDEVELLSKFLDRWNSDWSPDIVTGWNVEFFDVTYVINRIKVVLGEEQAKRMSPWKMISQRTVEFRGKTSIAYDVAGIAILDYLQLYRKFSFKNQESYKLDYIAEVECGARKVAYNEYRDLDELMEKDPQKYITYNNHDNVLVLDELDNKLRFIEQIMALAYDAKVNYNDTLTTVKMWDTIIHNYLMDRNIVIPQKKEVIGDMSIPGGFVKDPESGSYQWIVSFDLNSLYPHLIMQYAISPENFVCRRTVDIDTLLDIIEKGGVDKLKDTFDPIKNTETYRSLQFAYNNNYAMAANGCCYRRDQQGFLPALMDKLYTDRTVYKKKMIEAKKKYEETHDPLDKINVDRYHNFQLAKKIQLNSAYGALANTYYRWYDLNNASAITLSGQLSIRWIERCLNQYMNKLLKTNITSGGQRDYVIAADTDSIYLNLDTLVNKWIPRGEWADVDKQKAIVDALDKFCRERIEPFIDQCYQQLADCINARDQKMKMKREAIAVRGVWTGKKHYALSVWDLEGVRYHEPELKIQGIEAVRSSTPAACRDSIKIAIKKILNGSEQELQEFVSNFRAEFDVLPFDRIASPRSVSSLEKYFDKSTIYTKATPIQVRGALLYNYLIQKHKLIDRQPITDGDKIKFTYLRVPNPIHEDVIAAPDELPVEFGLEQYIDREKQFEKNFLGPVRSIAMAVGYDVEPVASLEGLFQ